MEFLRFILSDFYHWAGLVILIYAAGKGIAEIVRAARKGRRLEVHHREGFWTVAMDNPPPSDIDRILNKLNPSVAGEPGNEQKQVK